MHFNRSRTGVALVGAVAVMGWCCMTIPALADGPCDANDSCETAFAVGNHSFTPGNTCDDCGSDGDSACASSGTLDVWYSYTAECDGEVRVSLCEGSYFYNTSIGVHSGCPGTTGNEISCNAGDSENCVGSQAGLFLDAVGGTEYLIRVSGNSGECGEFDLTVNQDCDEPPSCNGECCLSPALCDGDVNGDGAVDPLDSGAILSRFGLDACTEEACQYDVNCDGAIDPLDTGYVLSRFGTCNEPQGCNCSPTHVFIDACEDAPVISLSPGEQLAFHGVNWDATISCPEALFFPGAPGTSNGDTWHAFELTETADVTLSHCNNQSGTIGDRWNLLGLIVPDCPCGDLETFIIADTYNNYECDDSKFPGDGNWTHHFYGVPAGVYYAPVIRQPGMFPFGAPQEGPYTLNVRASE